MTIKELKKEKLRVRKNDAFLSKVYGNILDTAMKIAKEENREVEENDIVKSVKKNIKMLNNTINQVGESKITDEYKKEIEVMKRFLPKMASKEEIEIEVKKILNEVGKDIKKMGMVIKAIKEKFGENVDMSLVSKIVKEEILKG